jgi:hypothetical protein
MKSIFVGIVSYRDKFLHQTLTLLCDNISNKYRIVVGVFDQATKPLQFESSNFNVEYRYMFIHHKFAKGCGWARYMNASQYQNEDYYFSVDSHMLFDENWDEKLIEQYERCGDKAVMTSMPYVAQDEKGVMKTEMFGMNLSHETKYFVLNKNLVPGAHGQFITSDIKETKYIYGGSTIARGDWVKDVLCNYWMSQYWMDGEEMTLTMESFFKGYKIYAAEYPVTAHLFYSTKKVWAYKDTEKQYSTSVYRGNSGWHDYLASKTEKELKQFYEYSGVDFINFKIDDWAAYVEWPFSNKPDYIYFALDLKKQLEHENTLI